MEKEIQRDSIKVVPLALFAVIAIVHIILTNLEGNYFAYTKVLLMPSLALFVFLSLRDKRKGFPIIWAETGLWLGNICLIWGEKSGLLFALGTAATIAGFLGYPYIMGRRITKLSPLFIVLQIPVLWITLFFVLMMKDNLGSMLIPIAFYMTLIALISLTALAQLMSHPRQTGAWLMFAGSLCYIGENGLYTADHYMSSLSFGPNIVHPFFIAAQALFAVGYLLLEKKLSIFNN